MPKLLREHHVGHLTVRMREKDPDDRKDDKYQTRYSVQVFENYDVHYIFNCAAFGNALDYIERRWIEIVKLTEEYVAEMIKEASQCPTPA